VAVKFLEIITC